MVHHIKLKTGEELFAELVDDKHMSSLRLINPLKLVNSEDEYGEMSVYFLNYVPYSDTKECHIDKRDVITCVEVNETAFKFYKMSKYFVAETDQHRMDSIEKSISSMSTTIYEDEHGMDDDIIGATYH